MERATIALYRHQGPMTRHASFKHKESVWKSRHEVLIEMTKGVEVVHGRKDGGGCRILINAAADNAVQLCRV